MLKTSSVFNVCQYSHGPSAFQLVSITCFKANSQIQISSSPLFSFCICSTLRVTINCGGSALEIELSCKPLARSIPDLNQFHQVLPRLPFWKGSGCHLFDLICYAIRPHQSLQLRLSHCKRLAGVRRFCPDRS